MPAVNREMPPLTHSIDIDTQPAVAPPVGSAASAASEVEAFSSPSTTPPTQQGSTVGAIAAMAVGQLDSNAVVNQVKELMGGWRVSGDDCRYAIGLLQSLPPRECAKALASLSRSGELKTLCESAPSELRRELAESAVHAGLTTTTPPLLSRGLRDPQPPEQPALISNLPSLPAELREVIHSENRARGQQYAAMFHEYVDAWCSKVASCRSPLELRALGPMSSPPRLLEPGISADDFKAKRYVSDLCPTSIGAQRAVNAVSAQVDVFRKEMAAGSFGLTFEVRSRVFVEGETGHSGLMAGGEFVARGTLTQDGRLVDRDAETEQIAGAGHGHNKVEARFNDEGHLSAVAVETGGFGLDYDHRGDTRFKVPVGGGLAAESVVNVGRARMGATVLAEEEGELFGAKVKVEGRVGFTYQGLDRAYYADIGGAQEGFFGPMPELNSGTKWQELPKERREWYSRQGFDEHSWPG